MWPLRGQIETFVSNWRMLTLLASLGHGLQGQMSGGFQDNSPWVTFIGISG
jgi:hypothetical protein